MLRWPLSNTTKPSASWCPRHCSNERVICLLCEYRRPTDKLIIRSWVYCLVKGYPKEVTTLGCPTCVLMTSCSTFQELGERPEVFHRRHWLHQVFRQMRLPPGLLRPGLRNSGRGLVRALLDPEEGGWEASLSGKFHAGSSTESRSTTSSTSSRAGFEPSVTSSTPSSCRWVVSHRANGLFTR